MGTLGQFLSSARESMGIDLHEAAQRTRISIHYLKALEEENFAKLPGEVFVRGFLKNYGRFLNLYEAEILKRYCELQPQPAVTASSAPALPEKPSPYCEQKKQKQQDETPLEPVIWGAVAFIGLVIFLFTALPGRHKSADRAATPAPSVSQQAAGDAAPAQPTKLYLEIVALEDTWLLIRTDSSPQKKAVLKRGEAVTWSAEQRFLLSYGSVGAAKLLLNGAELAVNGPKSAVVRDLTVTAAGIVGQQLQVKQSPPAKPALQAPVQPKPAQQPANPPSQTSAQAPVQPKPTPEPASPSSPPQAPAPAQQAPQPEATPKPAAP